MHDLVLKRTKSSRKLVFLFFSEMYSKTVRPVQYAAVLQQPHPPPPSQSKSQTKNLQALQEIAYLIYYSYFCSKKQDICLNLLSILVLLKI